MKTFEEWKNWDREKLDRIYSPSIYNNRLTAEEVLLAHHAAVEQRYKEVTELVPVQKDISYGPTEGQKIDIFNDNPKKGAPILVYFHGGYWAASSKKQGSFIVVNLVQEADCTVILVDYDLAPKVTLQEIVSQTQVAARKAIEIAQLLGSSGVYFSGHSAGAHLAVMVATAPWLQNDTEAQNLIKGYICISGIYDLRPLVNTYVNEPLQMTEQDALVNSPVFQLDTISRNVTEKCSFLVIAGENDTPEFIRQSQEFHEALEELKVHSSYLMVPNVDHFNLVEELADKDYILTQEILKFIKNGDSK